MHFVTGMHIRQSQDAGVDIQLLRRCVLLALGGMRSEFLEQDDLRWTPMSNSQASIGIPHTGIFFISSSPAFKVFALSLSRSVPCVSVSDG